MKKIPNPSVIHQENSLIITIPEMAPAALHNQLLKGLTNAMRNYALVNDSQQHLEGHLSLIKLLENLLPDEYALQEISKFIG